jgi:hypothetical protein
MHVVRSDVDGSQNIFPVVANFTHRFLDDLPRIST